MANPVVLMVAGEASGDRLGGALMRALRKKLRGGRFVGVGGAEMQGQGLQSLFPMEDLAVMGVFEVLPKIPLILRRLDEVVALAEREKPALVVTVDSQDFSARLAKRLKPLGLPHIHYVAPKVWAWRQGRAKKLAALYDRVLTILPFEAAFFAKFGLGATYVGHPAVTALAGHKRGRVEKGCVALLPGSRKGEIVRHWPLFLDAYRRMRAEGTAKKAVLALPDERALVLCKDAALWGAEDGISVVVGEERFAALAAADVALTKSGTNNLELALLGVPAVVAYTMNALTYQLARWLVKVPYISLPNLIVYYSKTSPAKAEKACHDVPRARRAVYPEYVQGAATAEKLAAAVGLLLTHGEAYKAQEKALAGLGALMATEKPPAEMAAAVCFEVARNEVAR